MWFVYQEKDWIEGKRSGVDGKIRKLDGSGQKRKRIVSEREEETLNLLRPKKRLRVEDGEEKKDLDVLKPNMEIKDVKETEGGELDELDEVNLNLIIHCQKTFPTKKISSSGK